MKHLHIKITDKMYTLLEELVAGSRGRGVSRGWLVEFVFWRCWGLDECRRGVLEALGMGVSRGSTGSTGSGGSGGGSGLGVGDEYVRRLLLGDVEEFLKG